MERTFVCKICGEPVHGKPNLMAHYNRAHPNKERKMMIQRDGAFPRADAKITKQTLSFKEKMMVAEWLNKNLELAQGSSYETILSALRKDVTTSKDPSVATLARIIKDMGIERHQRTKAHAHADSHLQALTVAMIEMAHAMGRPEMASKLERWIVIRGGE